MGMSKRLPGLVIEVENLAGFLAKPDEDILQHVRAVLLHRAYAVQRVQLAKCDGVQFSPDRDSCVFSAKGRALLHVRFAQLTACGRAARPGQPCGRAGRSTLPRDNLTAGIRCTRLGP